MYVAFFKNHLPKVARTPQAAQTTKQGPTAPTFSSTALGEIKIPEPITVPTMTQIPLIRPTLEKKWESMEFGYSNILFAI